MTARPLYDLLLVLSWTNAKLILNVKNCELILFFLFCSLSFEEVCLFPIKIKMKSQLAKTG